MVFRRQLVAEPAALVVQARDLRTGFVAAFRLKQRQSGKQQCQDRSSESRPFREVPAALRGTPLLHRFSPLQQSQLCSHLLSRLIALAWISVTSLEDYRVQF